METEAYGAISNMSGDEENFMDIPEYLSTRKPTNNL